MDHVIPTHEAVEERENQVADLNHKIKNRLAVMTNTSSENHRSYFDLLVKERCELRAWLYRAYGGVEAQTHDNR